MRRTYVKCKRMIASQPVSTKSALTCVETSIVSNKSSVKETKNVKTTKICFWHDSYLVQKRKQVTQEYVEHLSQFISIDGIWNIISEYVWCPIDLIHRELLLHYSEFTAAFSRLERVYGLLAIFDLIDGYQEAFHCMRMTLSYPLLIHEFSASVLRSLYFSRVVEHEKEEETYVYMDKQDRQIQAEQKLLEGKLSIETILNDTGILVDLTCYEGGKIPLFNSWSMGRMIDGNRTEEYECQRLLFEFGVTMGFITRRLEDDDDQAPSQWGRHLICHYINDVWDRGDVTTLSYLINDLQWDPNLLTLYISDSIFEDAADSGEEQPSIAHSFEYLLSFYKKQDAVSIEQQWDRIKDYVARFVSPVSSVSPVVPVE